jgi:hypothetical protein
MIHPEWKHFWLEPREEMGKGKGKREKLKVESLKVESLKVES